MRPKLIADRYRLSQLIGRGGMGQVWLATDEVLHREVAIKEIIPPGWLLDSERDELRERTMREARTAARLTHPHVVRVYDVVYDAENPWIVMEYVPSRSLQEIIETDGPVSWHRAAEIGLAVLTALRAAHRVGVLHRDIKPHNVLIGTDGRVMLTDFGLAMFEGDGGLTRSGLILGSPQYVAPERAAESISTTASDLWSLGATLYAAVEGRAPYARSTPMATLTALATAPLDSARQAGPLAGLLEGLLHRDPGQRLPADEAEWMLRRIVGPGPGTEAGGVDQRGGRGPLPGPVVVAAADEGKGTAHASANANININIFTRDGGGAEVDARVAAGGRDADPGSARPSGNGRAGAGAASARTASAGAASAKTASASPSGAGTSGRRRRILYLVAAAVLLLMLTSTGVVLLTGGKAGQSGARELSFDAPDIGRSAQPVRTGSTPTGPAVGPAASGGNRGGQSGRAGTDSPSGGAPRPGGPLHPGGPPPVGPPPYACAPPPPPHELVTRGSNLLGVVDLLTGWTSHVDPAGFKLAVPIGWERYRNGDLLCFHEPYGTRVLIVDPTTAPSGDPAGALRALEGDLVDNGPLAGYESRGIRTLSGGEGAEWTGRWVDPRGRTVQTSWTLFTSSANRAYTVTWHTLASDWEKNKANLDLIQRSFDG